MQIKSDRIVFPDNTEQFTAGGGSGGGSVETVDAPVVKLSNLLVNDLPSNVDLLMQFQTKDEDSHNCWDVATSRLTPTVAGWYEIKASAFAPIATDARFSLTVNKNNAPITTFHNGGIVASGGGNTAVTTLQYANGTTDYFQFYIATTNTSTIQLNNSPINTWASAVLVKPANSGTLVGGEPVTLDALGIPNHDKVTVDANGAVGIGYDTPSKWSVTDGKSLVVGKNNDNTALQGKMVISQRDDLAVGGSQGASIGAVFGENPIRSASIDFGCMGGSGQSGRITFNTKAENDDVTTPTEKMRIDADGGIYLGKDTTTPTANGWYFTPGSGNVGLSQGNFFVMNYNGTGSGTLIDFRVGNVSTGKINQNGTSCTLEGFTTRASDVYFSDDEENPRQGKSLKETLADRDKIIDKLLAKVEALEEKLKKVK